MSITGNFRAIPDDDLAALFERPRRVLRLLYGAGADLDSPGLLRRIFKRGDGTSDMDDWQPSLVGEELYVDKAWEGIHFLLTRTGSARDPALDFIVRGGREVGNIDVGYGPARALTSGEVRELDAAIGPLTADELRPRFDPSAMMAQGIYPKIWDRDPQDDDTLGYLLGYFEDLRDFIHRAAERDHGMLVYLS
jgi:hypothetical protein